MGNESAVSIYRINTVVDREIREKLKSRKIFKNRSKRKNKKLIKNNCKDDRFKLKMTITILNTNSLNIPVNGRDCQIESKIDTFCMLSIRNSF